MAATAPDRQQRILEIIETARSKRARFRDAHVTMAHGAGGKATASLIEGLLLPAFDNPAQYGKPCVIAGFEPLDILQAILMILRQLDQGRAEVENQYTRVVPFEGNGKALQVMAEVFELRPHFEWRGLGFISQSGLKLSERYAELDAEKRFAVPGVRVADPKACQCGEVLKGVIKPWECKVCGTACTPDHAIGTCMVSPEGACAAYYNYGRYTREKEAVS